MKKPLLILAALLLTSSFVRADEPPSWSEFEIVSDNGQYVAEIRAEDGGHSLSVYYRDRHVLYWSCDYVYDGYSWGALSNDGSTFAYVSFWYYADEPVVHMYREDGASGTVTGKEFGIPNDRLKDTVSHRLWLCGDCTPQYVFVYPEGGYPALEISTIDGNRHSLVMSASGEIGIGTRSQKNRAERPVER